jgi:hypothetical protein
MLGSRAAAFAWWRSRGRLTSARAVRRVSATAGSSFTRSELEGTSARTLHNWLSGYKDAARAGTSLRPSDSVTFLFSLRWRNFLSLSIPSMHAFNLLLPVTALVAATLAAWSAASC